MALTFDFSRIANHEALCFRVVTVDNPAAGEVAGERYVNAKTEAVVFGTMACGINKLEGDYLDIFIERMMFLERVHGARRRRHDPERGAFVDVYFTANELREYAGLRTNASSMTRTQFLANVYASFKRENASKFRA